MIDSCIPRQLEKRQIPDEYLAKAYEITTPQHRSWIKTALALGSALYNSFPGNKISIQQNNAIGFQLKKFWNPVSWTILLLDEEYTSAARLTAAIMPVRLAGVKTIFAIWINKNKPLPPKDLSPTLLATLELSGIILNLTMSYEEVNILIAHLTTFGQGRLLHFLDENTIFHSNTPIPSWKDTNKCTLAIDSDTNIDLTTLEWAHPNSKIETISKKPYTINYPDALYCSPDQKDRYLSYGVQRIFYPGLEAYWVHPELSPTFFLTTTWDISFINKE